MNLRDCWVPMLRIYELIREIGELIHKDSKSIQKDKNEI